jgi:hypothetical protein
MIFITLIIVTDWNSFVLTSVQAWENFYIEWLQKENDVLMIFYEELKNGPLEKLLNHISTFLGFGCSKKRMRCVLKHKAGRAIYHRKQKCHNNHFPFTQGDEPKYSSSNKQTNTNEMKFPTHHFNVSSKSYALEIYDKKHMTWINSAIKNVKYASEKRGIVWPELTKYISTQIRINICSHPESAQSSQRHSKSEQNFRRKLSGVIKLTNVLI